MPIAASPPRASLQSGRPWILSTLAAARTVGRITALGSCPKSTVPATSYGCSWRQDRESCVSPLPACCTTKRGGNGPRRVQFWVSPRDLTKILLIGRYLPAMPGLNGRPSRKGPPPRAIPALSGGAAAPALINPCPCPETNKKLSSNSRRPQWGRSALMGEFEGLGVFKV